MKDLKAKGVPAKKALRENGVVRVADTTIR